MYVDEDGICANRQWWQEALTAAEHGPPWHYARGFGQVLMPFETGQAFFRRWILKAHPDKKRQQHTSISYPTIDDVLALRGAHRRLAKTWPALDSIIGKKEEETPSSPPPPPSPPSCLIFPNAIALIIVGFALVRAFTHFVNGLIPGCRRRATESFKRTAKSIPRRTKTMANGTFDHRRRASRCATPEGVRRRA